MEEAWELAALVMARKAIPAAMKRAVEQEAGYRCAIPTCRDKGPFDFEHIYDWAMVQKHEFHNIILLCVGCHARVTRKEISKAAIRAYKRNLAIINGRYSLYEMRLLERYFSKAKFVGEEIALDEDSVIFVTDSDLIHLDGLIKDELIRANPIKAKKSEVKRGINLRAKLEGKDEHAKRLSSRLPGLLDNRAQYFIFPTEAGLEFVKNYFEGNEIE